MSTAKKREFITTLQYLESEKVSDFKREYADGQVYAMAGGSKNHDTLSTTVLRKFGNHLENSICRPCGPDLSIKTSTDSFRYADGMVVCEESGGSHYTQSPVIIVEVLSKSTRHIDKGVKLLEYINMPSLKEYVMIEQDFVSIDVLRKSEGWILRNYTLGDDLHFESIDLTLSVADIYHRVENEDMLAFLANKPK
jgi:Uma2 family endonuclease